jgi:hypothetical protein
VASGFRIGYSHLGCGDLFATRSRAERPVRGRPPGRRQLFAGLIQMTLTAMARTRLMICLQQLAGGGEQPGPSNLAEPPS